MDEYTSVEDQVYYGLDTIDPARRVEINLRDLVFCYKTLGELVRFFHQPMHYPTLEAVQTFLETVDAGAFALLFKAEREVLAPYLPPDIQAQLGDESEELVHPGYPYYYQAPE